MSSEMPAAADKPVRRRRRRSRKSRLGAQARPRSRKVKMAILAGVAALLVMIILVLVVFPTVRKRGTGEAFEFEVRRDEPIGQLADRLGEAHLVSSPTLFSLYARVTRASSKFIPGLHLLGDDLSAEELVRHLERRGEVSRAHVVIPEGWTRFDIARRLAKEHVAIERAFLDATVDPQLLRELSIDGDSAEGFLFPATYDLHKDGDPRDVVRRLVLEFEKRYAVLQRQHRGTGEVERGHGFLKRDVVTLASMIEKEAAVDDERPIIASVFLNRLSDPTFKRKVLQSDPTSAYGCLVLKDQIPACAGFTGKVTHDINVDPHNKYSTYVHERLPPGPICSPGTRSLMAVLVPSRTKYLYFVATGQNRHTFSENYEGHTAAVKGGQK